MLKLDKQRRLKIPMDLIEISNLNAASPTLYIILKGSDILLSGTMKNCFDGILAKVAFDNKSRFVMPNRIVQLLKLNENKEVLLYVNQAGYIGIKANN